MYAVIDTSAAPTHPTRTQAEQSLRDLREHNPAAPWQLMVAVVERPIDEIERLYVLAHVLLNAVGANPLVLGIEQRMEDGSTQQFSAATIMSDARAWLDQIQH